MRMIQLCAKDKQYSIPEREAFLAECTQEINIPHVLLATCNRVELYSGDGECSLDIARHLFRVTSGLESAFLGERHIQGQVKRAYQEAISRSSVSPGLHRLFQNALRVGKLVRSSTSLSDGAVSYSAAILDLLQCEKFLQASPIVSIVGINLMTANIVRGLSLSGLWDLRLFNRTLEKAKDLALMYGGTPFNLGRLPELVADSDVIICATGCGHTLVDSGMIPACKKRIIVDLAVPRNIDPCVALIPGVRLFDCEAVEDRINQNIYHRRTAVHEAESVIENALSRFFMSVEKRLRVC